MTDEKRGREELTRVLRKMFRVVKKRYRGYRLPNERAKEDFIKLVNNYFWNEEMMKLFTGSVIMEMPLVEALRKTRFSPSDQDRAVAIIKILEEGAKK